MRFDGTAADVASDELKTAVNAAIRLKRPLSIKDEPGAGETPLAEEIAGRVASTARAQPGLYSYDAAATLRLTDPRQPIPLRRGALLKNEQAARLFERLAFIDRRQRSRWRRAARPARFTRNFSCADCCSSATPRRPCSPATTITSGR